MSRLPRETLERMFNDEVRVSTVIHVQGSLSDCESPAEAMRKFIEEIALEVADQFEPKWPGHAALMKHMADSFEEERREDRRSANAMWICEVGDLYCRSCPAALLVCMEFTLSECISPNPDGECLGSWRSGWGYYTSRWYLVDSIEEAIESALSEQRARKVASWNAALAKAGKKPAQKRKAGAK